MSNPLYNNFSNNQVNSFAQLIQEARNFKNTFKGSPKDEVQRLLNSGAMSQQDFNRFSQVAQQVVQAMGEDF